MGTCTNVSSLLNDRGGERERERDTRNNLIVDS